MGIHGTQFAGIALDDAFAILYGVRPSAIELAKVETLVGAKRVRSLSDLRKIIMGHDLQTLPTRATIRFDSTDLRRVELDGFSLILDTADVSVSTPILEQRRWEPFLTQVFRRYIRRGMRVADVGANVGYYTMLAASLVGSEGEVFAFEPNSENCRLLLQSAAANEFTNIHLFPLALAQSVGHTWFSTHIGSNGGLIPASRSAATGYGSIVPTARFDSLIKPPLDFMKMDVEGAEFGVLRGGEELIRTTRPIIASEFSCEMISRVSGCTPREFLEFFRNHEYTIHVIRKDGGGVTVIYDIDTFLRDWGEPGRIEDLLMLPGHTAVATA